MLKTSVQLVSEKALGRRPGIVMVPQTLTIHSTANTATAQNERDNIANNSPELQVSFHLVVDDKEAINCIPQNEVAWHAGDGRKAGGGNMTSISLEICEGGDRSVTLRNAEILAASILKHFGWGVDHLRQHHDWSGKNCPRILRDTNQWELFVSEIQKELTNMEGNATPPEMIYNYIDENMPEWARVPIQWLVDNGVVKGEESGLNLDEQDLQYLVWLYRTFMLKK